MNARIPRMANPSAKQQRITDKQFAEYTEQALIIFQLCTLVALHECAGFGNKRLIRFMNSVREVCTWYDKLLSGKDVEGGAKGANLDTAVMLLVQKAEDYNIDWKEILGADLVGKCDPFRRQVYVQ